MIDKLAWIEIKNGKILTTRSFGKDKFYIPGGKREAGETDQQALIREIKEELSVDLIESSIQYFGTFEAQAHGHQAGKIVRMTCYFSDYQGYLETSSEIEEMAWLDSTDQDKISFVDILIFAALKEKGLLN